MNLVPRSQLKIKRSRAGLGLYTTALIPKGKKVIEYTGEMISNEEADRRGGRYLFEISSRRTLDGKGRDNIARYINHSCRPNCEVDIAKGRVWIKSRRAIKPGEELHYDYGQEYFKAFITKSRCRCEKCRERRQSQRKK